ncbi:MAG: ester cyclase [Candidatus Hydrothermarchaeota archaeon]
MVRRFAPTGKQVTWTGMAIYHLAGGKIEYIWGLNDALGIMQQIGFISR